jgi:hypothetical protein
MRARPAAQRASMRESQDGPVPTGYTRPGRRRPLVTRSSAEKLYSTKVRPNRIAEVVYMRACRIRVQLTRRDLQPTLSK